MSCQCHLSSAWINSNSRESSNSVKRVWNLKEASVHQPCNMANWGRTGDGTYSQIKRGLFPPPNWCHGRRTAPSRLAHLSVKKECCGKISPLRSASSAFLKSLEREVQTFLQQHNASIARCICSEEDTFISQSNSGRGTTSRTWNGPGRWTADN